SRGLPRARRRSLPVVAGSVEPSTRPGDCGDPARRLRDAAAAWKHERMKLGILCGGGPAPGMNSVISAATIEARNSGWDVLGIMDGFQHLIDGRMDEVRPLSITDVSRIHVQGGAII